MDEQGPQTFYALLGTIRGLLQAMVETQEAFGEISQDQWAATLF